MPSMSGWALQLEIWDKLTKGYVRFYALDVGLGFATDAFPGHL